MGGKSNPQNIEDILRRKVTAKYHDLFEERRHASPQFIVETATKLNKQLERSQYFFTEIVKEGIKLYDKNEFKLAKPRELSFKEIRDFAIDDFEVNFERAEDFLYHGNADLHRGRCVSGSFQLHQACECFYHSINLVFTNYRQKSHKLDELG